MSDVIISCRSGSNQFGDECAAVLWLAAIGASYAWPAMLPAEAAHSVASRELSEVPTAPLPRPLRLHNER